MFTITVTTTFRASHRLLLASGIEDLHEHDWVVEAAVETDKLNEFGFAIDFCELKKIMDDELKNFNGQRLEDLPCFDQVPASAENVAKYVFFSVKKRLSDNVRLKYVEVTESAGCRAKYSQ